jgi:hypothetical protein
MSEQPQIDQPTPRYVTIETASRMLGGALSPKTIRNKYYNGEWATGFGFCHIGGRTGSNLAIEWAVFEAAVVRK